MYTIDASLKQKFLDSYWMPGPLANTAGFRANTVNSGNIPVVNAVQEGSGYDSGTTVSIIRANTRPAVVSPVITSGRIVDYIVSDSGEGYISANVVIHSANGSVLLLVLMYHLSVVMVQTHLKNSGTSHITGD
jgi:hypothetical protein